METAMHPMGPGRSPAVAGVELLVDCFLSELRSALDAVIGSAGSDEMAAVSVAVERALRGVEAAATDLVDDADLRAVFLADGHRSVRGWVKATIRLTDVEVARRVRLAKLFRHIPEAAELVRSGRLGLAQARELARVLANPRCGDQLPGVFDVLVESALNDDFETFQAHVREWERLADQDGAHRDAEAAHAGRHASIVGVGDTMILGGQFGIIQGSAMAQILDAFADVEFTADWDEAVKRFGDGACAGLLARTAKQRRADALYAIFLAATGQGSQTEREVNATVNVVVDQATFEQQLADMADPYHPWHRNYWDPNSHDHGDGHGHRGTSGGHGRDGGGSPAGTGRFCRTIDGLPVDPVEAVAAAMVGHVRRVVIGSGGVIIDLGRRSRCFTGSARDAAILQAAMDRLGRCIWPGCRLSHVQIDHTTAWARDGATDVANAGPLCGHHNRFKTHGYTTHRDEHGRWHTRRPDGTEIRAA